MKTLAFALLLAAPLAAQPFIGAERAIAPYRDAPRLGYKSTMAGAGAGDGFLAAWTESSDRSRVYGTRLTRDGKIAEGPFVITSLPQSTYGLTLRADGTRYVLGAQDYYAAVFKAWQISPAGVAEVPPDPAPPLVANSTGEHILTTWERGELVVTFLDSRNLLHGPPVRTNLVYSGSTILNVRPLGDDWTILTQAGDIVQWIRVSHTDVVGTTVILPVLPYYSGRYQGRSLSRPAIDGATVSFAWTQLRDLDDLPASEWERVLAYTVVNMETGASSERHIDTTRFQLPAGEQRSPSLGTPAVIFNGREFVYAWNWQNYAGDAEVRVVHGTGAPRVLARGHDVFPYSLNPVLGVGTGGRDLLLWQTKAPTPLYSPLVRYDVFARPIDASSSIDDGTVPAMITPGVTVQRRPREASGPGGTLTVWNEYGEQAQIRARFFPVSSNGRDAFTISEEDGSADVFANADAFLVVWREASSAKLLMRRFDAGGTAIDTQPVPVTGSDYYGYFNVLADGNSFIFAYNTSSGSLVTRVPSRGPITFSPVKLADPSVAAQLVRLAGRVVAVWLQTLDGTGELFKGARLKDNLTPEPTVDMWLVLRKPGFGSSVYVAQANDKELLIVHDGNLLGEAQECVRTRRFGLNLLPLGEASALSCQTYNYDSYRMLPKAAWDGERWRVLYSSSSYSSEPLRLWTLDAGGKPQPPLTLTETQRLLDISLVRTPLGLAALYTRADENAAATFRAFHLPLLKEQPKARSARH